MFAGAQGPQGAQGSTGAQGPQGNIGSQGVAGAQGNQGYQGSVGSTGAKGPQGNVGVQGATGPQGTQGRQGSVGATGAQGPQGNVGAQGTQGRQGYQGKQGSTGKQGLVGPQGYSGSQGPSGPQGTTGPQGAAGPSLRDITKNLKVNYQSFAASITADGVVLSTSTNITKAYLNISIASVYLDSSGANGLDKGSRAIYTWYNLWLIGKTDGTIAGLWSLSPTSPTMPTGYTYKAWIGAVFSTSMPELSQRGNLVAVRNSNTLNVIGTNLNISLANYIPTQAVKIGGYVTIQRSFGAGSANLTAQLTPDTTTISNSIGLLYLSFPYDSNTGTFVTCPFSLPIITPQRMSASESPADMATSIEINTWEYP